MHDDDDVTDSYRPKDGMTVFGFGRALGSRRQRSLLRRLIERVGGGVRPAGGRSGLLHRVPATLIIGLVEAREFEGVKAGIERIYRAATDPDPRAPDEPARAGRRR